MAKRRKQRSSGKCAGLKRSGKLKKGFKFKKGQRCPVPAKK